MVGSFSEQWVFLKAALSKILIKLALVGDNEHFTA